VSEHVVVRAIAGPLTGALHRLVGGETWRVGTPPAVLVTALGEGALRVEPFLQGVRVDGRELVDAETVRVGATPRNLELPDGTTLWLVLSTTPLPVTTPERLELELDAPAPLPEPGRRRWRVPRPPLRLPRVSLPFRVSRAVGTSLAVHALLAVLLLVALWLAPDAPQQRSRVFHIRFGGDRIDVPPEAREGAAPEIDASRGEGAAEPDRSVDRALDDVAAALDAEHGRGADPRREADGSGVGDAPSGDLLAARRGGRERLLREGGGDAATEGALSLALGWLARHQSLDGTWHAREYSAACASGDRCAGDGDRAYREATTALALLPFLGAGHTHRDGPWRETVRDGLAALVRLQREDGSFGNDPKRAYASATATLVLAEAYGMTGSAALREPARRAARYFVERQSDSGGWRYHPGDGKADTSITGWVTIALVSARRAGLGVPAEALDGCRRWMVAQTGPDGRVGYTGRGRGTDALLGVGLFCRHLLGADATGPDLAPIARRLAGRRPQWPSDSGPTGYGVGDPMHWYYGSLAAFQADGDAWLMWESQLRDLLLRHQEREGCEAGSWDAFGSTGAHGGRVIATALCALCLEVTYRYPRATFGR
jgi:hypothetical protein